MDSIGLGHMDEKTNLSESLGTENKNILGINMSWTLAFADYTKGLPFPVHMTTSMLKPVFMKKLLALAGKESLFEEGVNMKLWSQK